MHKLRGDMFDKLQPGVMMWRGEIHCTYTAIASAFFIATLEKLSWSYKYINTQIDSYA